MTMLTEMPDRYTEDDILKEGVVKLGCRFSVFTSWIDDDRSALSVTVVYDCYEVGVLGECESAEEAANFVNETVMRKVLSLLLEENVKLRGEISELQNRY